MAFAQENTSQIDDLKRKYVENGQFNGTLLVPKQGKSTTGSPKKMR
jgi:hypothetical protein